jgi:hypothetical protein
VITHALLLNQDHKPMAKMPHRMSMIDVWLTAQQADSLSILVPLVR